MLGLFTDDWDTNFSGLNEIIWDMQPNWTSRWSVLKAAAPKTPIRSRSFQFFFFCDLVDHMFQLFHRYITTDVFSFFCSSIWISDLVDWLHPMTFGRHDRMESPAVVAVTGRGHHQQWGFERIQGLVLITIYYYIQYIQLDLFLYYGLIYYRWSWDQAGEVTSLPERTGGTVQTWGVVFETCLVTLQGKVSSEDGQDKGHETCHRFHPETRDESQVQDSFGVAGGLVVWELWDR